MSISDFDHFLSLLKNTISMGKWTLLGNHLRCMTTKALTTITRCPLQAVCQNENAKTFGEIADSVGITNEQMLDIMRAADSSNNFSIELRSKMLEAVGVTE